MAADPSDESPLRSYTALSFSLLAVSLASFVLFRPNSIQKGEYFLNILILIQSIFLINSNCLEGSIALYK